MDVANEQRSCTNGKYFGAALLCLLLIQNTSAVLLARYTRTKYNYNVNHMLLVAEGVKLVASIFLEGLVLQNKSEGGFNFIQSFRVHLVEESKEALKLAVPAGLYLMQNFLVYYSISLIPVPLFQITQQTKLVTTAILSVVFLKRSYSCVQWCSVLSLCVGAAFCVLSSTADSTNIEGGGDHIASASSRIFGLFLLVLSNLSGSMAGVYFEVLIKGNGRTNEKNTPPPSIWMRNVQLAFFTICIITLQLFISHNGDEDKATFFYDFTPLLWVQVRLI